MNINKDIIKKIAMPIIKCFAIAVLLELTLFNFRAYQSRGYDQVSVTSFTVSDNLIMRDWNIFEASTSGEEVYIDVAIEEMKANNVYVDIWPNAESFNVNRLKMHFFVTDEGNPTGYNLPTIDYTRGVMQTMYTFLDLSGKCKTFRVVLENINEGEQIRVENISFNTPTPFSVSKKRILSLSIILMLLYFFRPSSGIYKRKATESFKWKKPAIAIFAVVSGLLMWNVVNLNGAVKLMRYETEHQFEMMAEALVSGSPYLLKEAPKELAEVSNPYSYQERVAAGVQDSVMYDTGYYNGHYFVYFGVGPILLFYVPYYLITGSFLPSHVIMFFIGMLTMFGWLMLLYEIIKKYFKDFSFALYLIMTALFTSGCGLTYVLSRPDFYPIPMTMGLVCVLFGLAFWLKSLPENDEDKINPIYICIGSFFMAFTAACRPQFLIASVFAIVLFWKSVFKNRTLFSKKGITATICAIIPYVIVAGGVMYYNWIRFANPFDFGANYNLTFNDMTYRGFKLDRFLYAFLGFFFMPAKVMNKFPYFAPSEYTSRFMGYSSNEQLLGGLFYNHFYLLAIVFIPKAKKLFKDKGAFILAVIAPIMAVIVAVVDANMAGVLNRYFVDFSWLVMISFILLFGYVITDEGMNKYKSIISNAMYALAILSFIHMFFMIFGGDVNGLENNNIQVFYKVAHMIEFWN